MNTEDSVAWFRAKNARRKQEKQNMPAKKLHEQRRWRRSLRNGAFGNKEDQDAVTDSTVVG